MLMDEKGSQGECIQGLSFFYLKYEGKSIHELTIIKCNELNEKPRNKTSTFSMAVQ